MSLSFPPSKDVAGRINFRGLMHRRQEEIFALLNTGKIIISFLVPRFESKFALSNNKSTILNNYSWLPNNFDSHFIGRITSANGAGLKLISKNNLFTNYYHAFKGDLSFAAYINIDSSGFESGDVLITNFTNQVAGFSAKLLNGLIVFLPIYASSTENDTKFEGVILGILKKYFGENIKTTPPDWVSEYVIPGVDKLDYKIIEVATQIKDLESQKLEIEESRNSLDGFKELLYEQGHILQDKVVEALRLMGFKAETVITENTDYDVVMEAKEGRAIAEVEGKDDNAIHKEKIDQLLSAINQDVDEKRAFAKGVMVGNHYRKKKPDEREDAFTETSKNLALKYQFALITTVELYNAVIYLLEHPDDEEYKTICREAIFQSIGTIVQFPKK